MCIKSVGSGREGASSGSRAMGEEQGRSAPADAVRRRTALAKGALFSAHAREYQALSARAAAFTMVDPIGLSPYRED